MKNLTKILLSIVAIAAIVLSATGATNKSKATNINSANRKKVSNKFLFPSSGNPFGCGGYSTDLDPFNNDLVYGIDLGTGGFGCDTSDPFGDIWGNSGDDWSDPEAGRKYLCKGKIAYPNPNQSAVCEYTCTRSGSNIIHTYTKSPDSNERCLDELKEFSH